MDTLQTDRLLLRPLDIADAPFILNLLNQPSFLHNIGDRGVHSLLEAEGYIQAGPLKSYERFGFGLMLVTLKNSRIPLGICGLIKRDTLENIDIGFAFLPEFWSKGYATEAASAILADGKNRLNLGRIVAIVLPGNAPSIRVLERIGLKFEHSLRLPGDAVELSLYANQPATTLEEME